MGALRRGLPAGPKALTIAFCQLLAQSSVIAFGIAVRHVGWHFTAGRGPQRGRFLTSWTRSRPIERPAGW